MPASGRTHYEWVVLAVSCMVAVVLYLDRVNIAIAGPLLIKEYDLSRVQLGLILSAFSAGYAIFMIPSGWLVQRLGPRLSLLLMLLTWGIFTYLTVVAGGIGFLLGSVLWGFILIRFLLGAAEATSLPGLNLTTSIWAPQAEIGRFTSLWLGSLQLGAAITPVVVATLMVSYGWRFPFYVLALVSALAAVVWWLLVRDRVRQLPWVNETEAAHIEQGKIKPGPTPWGKIWRHRSTWFLTASYSFQGYVASVYIFWMYLYITTVRHVPLVQGAWLATLPPIVQLVMAPIGGFASDLILSWTGNRTLARRSVAMSGMFATGVLVLIGAFTTNTTLAIAILALGAGFLWLATSMFWAAASDLAGPHSGGLSSIMNTGANVFSFFGPTVTPLIGRAFGYEWALVVVTVSAVISGLLWLGVELHEPLTA